ncbi:hypothetical protein PHIM7_142 [Sinorhizobium phage phiM7]|uniref:Uncharacterized protein n=2 Tax=Emdodecavirus TaxID=1980937 RepID=S5M6Z8_9CAUD|nr:hypothetical protein AB690_gp355 [Sinorhizobium phage phiM12]YP_009601267.1 hypothetical protein FDH46_gp336 [Sinorhizobium phage phiM7]AGR47841.1 hypothetical protein SmphiM12_209 [Sinorhizobium phage phiM12]AKF12688.1 hypothetical protein PHIM7_142 [Sinorhizobium phage phiM7]AKF13047.1 hypothetical protein PHIM19_142 [Sinorhizobium phage phiM19]
MSFKNPTYKGPRVETYPDPTSYDCSGSIPDDRLDALYRVTHERDMLAEAIANAAIKAGIYNGVYGKAAGPFMLMLCEDMAEVIKSLEDNIGVKADWIEATINDSAGEYEIMHRTRDKVNAILLASNDPVVRQYANDILQLFEEWKK